MSNTILDNALKRRDELQAELAELERLISFYEDIEKGRNRQGRRSTTDFRSAFGEILPGRKPRGRPAKIADAVHAILLSLGRPMTRGEIANELKKRGFSLPQADPAKYVGTVLWRQQDRFVHLEGEGYWVKGRRRK